MTVTYQVFKKILERRAYAAGATVFREGEKANTAFVLLRGDVQITTTNAAGKAVALAEIKIGQIFGELALMSPDSRRTATASTATSCEVMILSHTMLQEKLDAADPFVKFWLQYLSERLIESSKRV